MCLKLLLKTGDSDQESVLDTILELFYKHNILALFAWFEVLFLTKGSW
jgi:hypothetical protein